MKKTKQQASMQRSKNRGPLPDIPTTTNPTAPIPRPRNFSDALKNHLSTSNSKVVSPKTPPEIDSPYASLSDSDDHSYMHITPEGLDKSDSPEPAPYNTLNKPYPKPLNKPAIPEPDDDNKTEVYGNFGEYETGPNAYRSLVLDLRSDSFKEGAHDDDRYVYATAKQYEANAHRCPAKVSNVKKGIQKNETWQKPLLLVDNSESGKFSIVPSTLKKVKEITGPVVVVSIIGPYRTGKSYLMNKIFKKRNGFAVDSSVQAKTKGIWVWSHEPLVDQGPQILLLDTEGLGDAKKVCGSENDINIFVLTCLLSTCMIYNSKGVIDQTAIDNLKFVTDMSSKLSIFSDAEDAEPDDALLGMYFPQLLWVIRDFSSDLKGQTPDEYMQDVLALKPGVSGNVQKYNATRQCITTYFPNRRCFVFPPPVKDFDLYSNLSAIEDALITAGFHNSLELLTEVLRKAVPKNFNGRVTDGPLFACLVEQFTSSLAENKIPNIETALSRAVCQSNEDVLAICVQNYKKGMDRLNLPTVDGETLQKHHSKYFNRALEFIKMNYKTADPDQDELFQCQLKEALELIFSEISSRNEDISYKKSRQALEVCMSDIMTKLEGDVYMEARGYKRYQDDFNKALDKYRLEPGKGLMDTAVLLDFKKEMSSTEKAILEVDKALKKQEKDYIERSQIDQIHALHKAEEIRKELQRKCENEFQRKFETVKSNFQAKFDEKEDRMIVDAETLMNFLDIEREKLNAVGCKDNAKFLGDFISTVEGAVQKAKAQKTKKKSKKSFKKPGFLKALSKRRTPEYDEESIYS